MATSARRVQLEEERLDLTELREEVRRGAIHPVTQARDRLEDVFVAMGFTGLMGKLLTGRLSDLFDERLVTLGALACLLVGWASLSQTSSFTGVLLAALPAGFGAGDGCRSGEMADPGVSNRSGVAGADRA